jgi:two-component system, LytTR family, sensor kinase
MNRFWQYKLDHVIFWVATVAFHMFTRADLVGVAGPGQFLGEVLVRNGLLAIVIYINLLIFIPRFIHGKKFLLYAVSLLLLLFGYALAKNVHDVYLYGEILSRPGADNFFSNTFYNLSIALFYVAFSIALQLSREWYHQRELIRKIEIEKLNTELAYLRSQINPHFLFNSINTIYFQIDKKNTEARETLSRFSEMLRYQLYECNGKEVPIEKEIQYLQNYIDLQRLRKGENYQIEFRSDDRVRGFTIAPLVLICFVENAFKHVSNHSQGNRIKVELSKNEGTFRMSVFNTWDGREKVNDENAGIGLRNVKRRLELLYPGRHDLYIAPSGEDFKVELTLKVV